MDTQKPIKTFRDGAVAASVWLRQTSADFGRLRQTSAGVFYDVTFSRCWKNEETDKFGYSQSFSDYHLDPLAELAQEAPMRRADQKANAEPICLGQTDEEPFCDAIGPD